MRCIVGLGLVALVGCGGPPDEEAAAAMVLPAFDAKAKERGTCARTQTGGTGPMTFGVKEMVLHRCLVKGGYVDVVSPYADNALQYARYEFTEKGKAAGLGKDDKCRIPMAIPEFEGVTRLNTVDDTTIEVIYSWKYEARTDTQVVQCFRHPALDHRGRINGRAEEIGELREGRAILKSTDGNWALESVRL